jgi:hypothetical protein
MENLEIEFSRLRPERGGALLSKANSASFGLSIIDEEKTVEKISPRKAKFNDLNSGLESCESLTLLYEKSQHCFLKPQSAFFVGQHVLKLSNETYTFLLLLQAIWKTVTPVAESSTEAASMKANDLSTIFFIAKQKYKLYRESSLNLYHIHVNLLHQSN